MKGLDDLYRHLIKRSEFLNGACDRTEKALGRESYSYGQIDGQRFECEAVIKEVGEMILNNIAESKKEDDEKPLIEMTIYDIAELCASRHQECTDKTDWETECPFYDSEEKQCILQRRPFGWDRRINEMESLEKLYKNMKGKQNES